MRVGSGEGLSGGAVARSGNCQIFSVEFSTGFRLAYIKNNFTLTSVFSVCYEFDFVVLPICTVATAIKAIC